MDQDMGLMDDNVIVISSDDDQATQTPLGSPALLQNANPNRINGNINGAFDTIGGLGFDGASDEDSDWLGQLDEDGAASDVDDAAILWQDHRNQGTVLGKVVERANSHSAGTSKQASNGNNQNYGSTAQTFGPVGDDPAILNQQVSKKVLEYFPDLCPEFLIERFNTFSRGTYGEELKLTATEISERIINSVLEIEGAYPKRELVPMKKRKREGDEDDLAKQTYTAASRWPASQDVMKEFDAALRNEFRSIPADFIVKTLKAQRNLFPAYTVLDAAMQVKPATLKLMSRARIAGPEPTFTNEEYAAEFECARRACRKSNVERNLRRKKEQEDAEADQRAFAQGDVVECGCCFTDTPTAKCTRCSADPCHHFCFECGQNYAKAQLENQRYKLTCMDGSRCEAEFSHSEKLRFLDAITLDRLDRLQRQDELRRANIEGIEECPHCDYMEIYPPIELNKIFICRNENCDATNICRLCRLADHMPKSCEENRKDLGVSERNTIAEAMTEALIRKCPKCGVSIIKSEGCNKVTCTKCSCCFCDVCKKDITRESYNHFEGNSTCSQADQTWLRNQNAIKNAEKATKDEILKNNPTLKPKDLDFNFSEKVENAEALNARGAGLNGHVVPLVFPPQYRGRRNAQDAGRPGPLLRVPRPARPPPPALPALPAGLPLPDPPAINMQINVHSQPGDFNRPRPENGENVPARDFAPHNRLIEQHAAAQHHYENWGRFPNLAGINAIRRQWQRGPYAPIDPPNDPNQGTFPHPPQAPGQNQPQAAPARPLPQEYRPLPLQYRTNPHQWPPALGTFGQEINHHHYAQPFPAPHYPLFGMNVEQNFNFGAAEAPGAMPGGDQNDPAVQQPQGVPGMQWLPHGYGVPFPRLPWEDEIPPAGPAGAAGPAHQYLAPDVVPAQAAVAAAIEGFAQANNPDANQAFDHAANHANDQAPQ